MNLSLNKPGASCSYFRNGHPNPSLFPDPFCQASASAFASKSTESTTGASQPTIIFDGIIEPPCQDCTNSADPPSGIYADNVLDMSNIIMDTSSVASRCSVRLIHETVSTFGPQKRELVRAVGFHGLLNFPSLKQINLRFSAWLMSRVDELSQSLHTADGTRIPFTKEDIGMVFGIPSSGRSILPKTAKHFSGNVTPQSAAGHIDVKQLRSIKAAQAIVARHHDGPMSLSDQDEFKAAFVVFVMSTLLAPCGKHDRAPDDYMHIIVQPGQINSYDWAEYVMRRLLEAVSKLKADLASKVKMPYIYGCSLFLQVLYLDSIDLGTLSMEHNTFPRVRCFTYDRLRVMIAADSSFSAYCSNNIGYSYRPKLRAPAGICYHWATTISSNAHSTNEARMLALWEALTLMTRIFKIPLEAAGPLFVAVSDFQRQISSVEFQRQLSSVLGSEALRLICLLLHIIEPYVNGFRYMPSINADSPPIGLRSMWQSQACSNAHHCSHSSAFQPKRKSIRCAGESPTHTGSDGSRYKRLHTLNSNNAVPPHLSTSQYVQPAHNGHDNNIRAMKSMARFFLSLRPDKDMRRTDLNTLPTGDEIGSSTYPAHERYSVVDPMSPWDLGCTYHIDVVKAAAIYKNISMVEETDVPWIVHYCPKYIEVRTGAVKAQFLGKSEMDMELVDAVLRRFKQQDDELYLHQQPARWRHYVESDFMVSLLAGSFDISDPVVRSHFRGQHLCYDVRACKIVFFPALLQYRWACFAWRLQDNTIVVYDPYFSSKSQSFPLSYYERVANLLKSAMAQAADNIFLGWRHDWEEAGLEFFHHTDTPLQCPNRSGALCLYFCRCFDGEHLRPHVDPAHVQDISATLLAEVSSLAENLGSVPALFR